MINKVLKNMFENSKRMNEENILKFLKKNPEAKILDLGCDDGKWTLRIAKKIEAKKVSGIEIVGEKAKFAEKSGVSVKKSDLNKEFPFDDNEFDVVHANQVIEHISNLDKFVSEIYRVLKKDGYIIISTENGSSWHNIFASILGWQIFSLTNISSKKMGIGNPLALHRNEKIDLISWTHKTIFNYLGLKEFFSVYGFKNIEIKGAGYYPFPSFFGRIDTRHSHFITLRAYKK
jgi:ubiquinone/menaquinone biosynthesis C-methylase UbiE